MIIHLDMDAFFASVEQHDFPSLRGKPVAVAGVSDRGVVSTASYEARKFGVRSAMPVVQALRKCPELKVVPHRFSRYTEVSSQIRSVLENTGLRYDMVSIDEGYLEIPSDPAFSPRKIADSLRTAIGDKTGLPVSLGIAATCECAKIAGDIAKPSGLLIIPEGTEREFLAPFPVQRLPGVGEQTLRYLNNLNILSIGDLAVAHDDLFGNRMALQPLQWLARGGGRTRLPDDHTRKSISEEETFPVNISEPGQIRSRLQVLCISLAWRLRNREFPVSGVTVKIRTGDFATYTRSERITDSRTPGFPVIWKAATSALNRYLSEERPQNIRLLGVGVSRAGDHPEPLQGDLFST